LSESEGEYEYQSDPGAEGKLTTNSIAAAAAARKKQRVEEWK
jgi:hypothetical protein